MSHLTTPHFCTQRTPVIIIGQRYPNLTFWDDIYDLEDDTDPLGAKILQILLLVSILGDLVFMIFFRIHICVKLAVDYSKIHDSTTIVAFRTMTYVYVCLYRGFKRVCYSHTLRARTQTL